MVIVVIIQYCRHRVGMSSVLLSRSWGCHGVSAAGSSLSDGLLFARAVSSISELTLNPLS